MATDPDESYYAEQYMHWLGPFLTEIAAKRVATILDAGCGQGRLAIAVARRCPNSAVVGVDISEGAVNTALQHAADAGLSNLEIKRADVARFAAGLPSDSIDLALFVEVSFFMPAYREALREISRVVKPGGILFASFRGQYFNLLSSVRARHLESARTVIERRSGVLWDTPFEFCWHTCADIREELGGLGFDVEGLYGIGILSGIENDPLAGIARPSQLSTDDRQCLLAIELELATHYAECGRYIAAVARRR